MDATTQRLADFASGFRYGDASAAAIHAAKRLLVDSLGCAVGGRHSGPAKMAERLAARSMGTPPARVLGSGLVTSIDAATFANTVMVRYLDFNEMYISKEAGHASDILPALLAVAEGYRRSGRDYLAASIVACETFTSFADAISLWDKGWDHGLLVVLGTAAGVGTLLGLSAAAMGEALSLAICPNVPLRQTRSGELSMWKGCATAASARAGVFAAMLAAEGMSGPRRPFEGRHGLFDQVTGPMTMEFVSSGVFGIERLALKAFPTEGHSQLPLWLAMQLREGLAVDEIATIRVHTYRFAYSEIGSEPQKWDPQTRETADHSLPYLLAAALADGGVSIATFDERRIRDPALRPLMRRIEVVEDPAYTARYPREMPCRVEIVARDGRRRSREASHPRGHPSHPMTDGEVEAKFRQLCAGRLEPDRSSRALEGLWSIDAALEVGMALDPLCGRS